MTTPNPPFAASPPSSAQAGTPPSAPGIPSPQMTAPPEPVALDVAILRQVNTASSKQVVLMKDGEVLKDGRGDPQAGDKFKIVFRSNCTCYVYVIAIDGSGWVQWLFPKKGDSAEMPVIKDREYNMPEGPYWFSLDQFRGVETIYFVASLSRRLDLEESLAPFAGRERPASMVPAKVEVPPIIPDGFGKTEVGQAVTVSSESGQQQKFTPVTYVAKQLGEDLRVTRWFKHE